MRKNHSLIRKGQTFGRWTLRGRIGGGGHGEVWEVSDSAGSVAAIKILREKKPKSYRRFRNEMRFLQENPSRGGVLPILDSEFPDIADPTLPWYVMPIATPLWTHLHNASIETIISTFIELSKALAALHAQDIAHRDIKPANLFVYEGSPVFGDFGLVDFPKKEDVTVKFEVLR